MLAFLFACTASTSAASALNMTAANVPAISRVVAAGQIIPTEKRLGTYEITNMADEERHNALSKMAKAIQREVARGKYQNLISKLELDTDFSAALDSNALMKLIAFCKKYNRGNKLKHQLSSLDALLEKYGDAILHNLAINGLPFNTVVSHLRQDLLRSWIKDGRFESDIFSVLNINENLHEAFTNGQIDTLLDDFSKLFRKEAYTLDECINLKYDMLLKLLMTSIGDENNLIEKLTIAKRFKDATPCFSQLEEALTRKWQAEELSLDAVWTLLRLSTDAQEALTSGKLRMFFEYTGGEYSSHNTLALKYFIAVYGEIEVGNVLVTTKNDYFEEEFVTYLLSQLLQDWVDNGRLVEDIFRTLKVNVDDVVDTNLPKLELLSEYIFFIKPQENQGTTVGLWYLARMITKSLMGKELIMSSSFAGELEEVLFHVWRKDQANLDILLEDFCDNFEESADSLDDMIVRRYHEGPHVPSISFNQFRRS